jgi:hypothetical protein
MFSLRSDMSELGRIYLVWGPDMFGQHKFRAAEKLIGSQDNVSRS